MRNRVDERLLGCFNALIHDGAVPRGAWPDDVSAPDRFGLLVDDVEVRLPPDLDLLSEADICAGLSARALGWLEQLRRHVVIGSTNAELMALSADRSIAGHVHVAELQVAGRGRRGRGWFSPFGANLAISLGFALARSRAQLGGLSLVAGLAAVDALEQCGVQGLALKWPNDLLLDGAKLGGILIEIVPAGPRTEVVLGIGLNVRLPDALRAELDQSVADLSGGSVPARSELAARLISNLVEFVGEFDSIGFQAFQEVFDARHYYHGRVCRILRGVETSEGTVIGVSAAGGLLLRGAQGVEEFQGGEVSLRPAG